MGSLGLLLIRADASTQIGTGHVMRCLALAQAWQEAGGNAQFVLANAIPAIEARLSAAGIEITHLRVTPGGVLDAALTAEMALKASAAWLVVDGYHFGATYQQTIKDAGLRLLFVDDYGHASHYSADVVLNQNIFASEGLYHKREPYTWLLLGTRYALLRREFWPWRGWQREIVPLARKLLVTLGGADPDNVTLKVVRALRQVEGIELEAMVVVGGSSPHVLSLQAETRVSRLDARLVQNTTQMPELMAWADLAVSAGGSTCWELAFMGLPNLALILADNQRPIAEGLDAANVAVDLGWHEDASPTDISRELTQLLGDARLRREMSRLGQQLVGGSGAQMVAQELVGGNGQRNAYSLSRE